MTRGPLKPLAFSAAAILLLSALLWLRPGNDTEGASLTLFCAAGLRVPVEAVAKAYREECGVEVRLEFGGSGTLLSALKTRGEGDLYLAADVSYIELARKDGLVAESLRVARQRPVIAVPKGNPKGIQGIHDLMEKGIRVSLANPDAASVGRTTQKMLQSTGEWESLARVVTEGGVFKPTVNDVANDVKIGTVDAGIVWDSTVALYPGLDAVSIPAAKDFVKDVTIGVLTGSKHPTEALRFARYLSARDRGALEFTKLGFDAVPGDVWAVRPEILYYAGGVNRVGIEKTLAEFSAREGVDITTVYNGCGILLGQIKKGGRPDVYHTCDISFMKGVESRFSVPDRLSRTKIVILVDRGNPHEIRGLADLGKAGLQVGVCDENQSTLGTLTARMLRDAGLYDAVSRNVVVTTPTADFLVSQLTVGKLDAAIVYEANTMFVGDRADVIYLDMPRAEATQTFASARETRYPMLIGRLHEALRSAESASRFRAGGFVYLPPVTDTP